MWFSPLKGAHLTLAQVDKTLPVDMNEDANKKIERGSIVYMKPGEAGGETTFALYTSTQAGEPSAVPFVALMSAYDFTAGMAGNVGMAPETIGAAKGSVASGDAATWLNAKSPMTGAQAVSGPRLTAISLLQAGEYQTSAFYAANDTDLAVGTRLTVNDDGKLVKHEDGKNVVGVVTAAPMTRWVNDLGASEVGARISGGNVKVIAFMPMWIPAAAVAQSAEQAPATQSVKAPKVVNAQAAEKAPEAK